MNMSYCRWHNTRLDLSECLDYAFDPMSEDEKRSAERLFHEICNFLEGEGIAEIDWDALEEWLDEREVE